MTDIISFLLESAGQFPLLKKQAKQKKHSHTNVKLDLERFLFGSFSVLEVMMP